MKKLIYLTTILIVLVSCKKIKEPKKLPPTKQIEAVDGKTYTVVDSAKLEDPKIRNYGNGVYYFDYNREKFAPIISKFLKENSNLELITLSGNGTGIGMTADEQGQDCGYFVFFREKSKH